MVFTEYRLINKLITVVMVRWVEEMGGGIEGLGKRRRRRKRRKRRKEVIKKIGSKRKIRRRKKKKWKLW
ncbi:hypothetical protein KEC58_04250 [Photobacterium damselae]|uniref:hypothetical protein n=1 Tax=Photobacterium damselae TaxID=38293 RepID=UPI0025434585